VRAIVHDPAAGLRHTDVPDPVPRPHELLLEVGAAALNFLDVAYRDEIFAPGAVPGVDAAGVVLAAAADGSGPPAGTRVATFAMGGAWARRRAVATPDVAVVPDGVELAVAAALPAAGITALQAVRRLGPLLGRRVLVTGASGGVGRYAVQLAARAGADVVAAVGSPARGAGLAALGAREVVTDLAEVRGPVHGVLDNVGGPLLAEAFALLAPGGLALSIGQASGQPTTIDFERERRRGGSRQLEPFTFASGVGPDLGVLLDLVARGELDPQIGRREDWHHVADVAQALLERRVPGKAVLEIG
jgi:NADPH:quinone reductase-like Zn-dependent oxidoreductase